MRFPQLAYETSESIGGHLHRWSTCRCEQSQQINSTSCQSLELRALEIVVAREHEVSVYPIDGNKWDQERCRKLHRSTFSTFNNDLIDRTPIIV